MYRTLLAAALILAPGLAAAQDQQAATGQPPKRIRSVSLLPDQKCPASTATEVVVCSPIGNPYRIPKALRDTGPIAASNQSWVNRTATADQIGRVAGGLPDTCSPVGTGGQSGCSILRNQEYAADRRAQKAGADSVP
ncbi:hypothetical protein [Sphingomonas sp. CROZ-RG-20F-R02-07]|nr:MULTISPECIES: hypothetical protein [unclassified Sphingomonas]